MTIRSFLVASVATLDNHAANRGEKLLGNASSVKRRPDGRVYISGQMQRHVLFSAVDRLNNADSDKGETYVSNGDGISNQIEKDLRGDLGGYMNPQLGEYSGRRTAPLSVTPAVALNESKVGQDLLIRLKMNDGKSEKKQAFATNEFSQSDEMTMNFHLDIGAVGAVKQFVYEDEIHVKTQHERKIDDAEHSRRIRLALEATRYMTDYANQARHAVSGEPNRVLIVLDPSMSRKAIQYWTSNEIVQQRILEELDHRKALYFIGNDADPEMDSVFQAYQKAIAALEENVLYRPEFTS